MSQRTLTFPGSPLTGTDLIGDIEEMVAALASNRSGTSRPSDIVAGEIWLDTTTATAQLLKFWDGTDDITLATINATTNAVTFTGTATSGANSNITSLSGLTTPLSVAQGGTGGTTALGTAAYLDAGTAALLDAGTDPGDVVQLNASGQLPAVDASLLTGLSALAKLALVANRVLYVNSAGVPTLLALGAAGTVLQSNGATAAPSFAAPAGGDGEWELVEHTEVTVAVAQVDYTGLNFTLYDYKVVKSPGLTGLLLRIGYGATPTWITGATYKECCAYTAGAAWTFDASQTTRTSFRPGYFPDSASCEALVSAQTTVAQVESRFSVYYSNLPTYGLYAGSVITVTIATAIRVVGTLEVGTDIKLYRRYKS